MQRLILKFVLLLTVITINTAQAGTQKWIEQSNAHTQLLFDLWQRYAPERVSSLGIEAADKGIIDFKAGVYERQRADTQALLKEFKSRLETAQHPQVRQDLKILIKSVSDNLHSSKLHHDMLLPYSNLPEYLFYSFNGLLEPRIAASRHHAVLLRLKKYVGKAEGYQPITLLAQARTAERFAIKSLIGPYVREVKTDLGNYKRYIKGIHKLLESSKLDGWQADFALLKSQLEKYRHWVEQEILPRARAESRLPEVLYADRLKRIGVEIDPQQLIERASADFVQLRTQMQTLSMRIAQQRKLPSGDYRAVIAQLKKAAISNDEVLELYSTRLKQIEKIIEREGLVSLPQRDASIRLASEAESASIPAPFMNAPRLIGNTGEHGEFVIPLANPNAASNNRMDDFIYDAAAWTLTAHEARPGHELQYSVMVENGTSLARAIVAFNSANVEGWALYAESLMLPYLPDDGRLIALQWQMIRAARAFLDPMVNLGLMTPADAKQFLMQEVILSEPMAVQEADRYSFRAPGQATAYYYGLIRLQALRAQTELMLKDKFNRKKFHDFLLRQGVVPADILQEAVMSSFVLAK